MGCGIIEYARVLVENGIDMLAVSTAEEAIVLKKSEIKADVMLLASNCIKSEVKELIDNDVILTIGSKEAAEIANELATDKKARVHIKIDTGFGRYGFIYNNVEEIINAYKKYPNLQIEGTFSHFAQAYEKKLKVTKIQFDRFISVIETLRNNNINPGLLHICNSSAFLKFPYMHLNASRIGSAFLGRVLVPNNLELKRIGSMESKIIEIKDVPKGYSIGYSGTEKTKRASKIAIIPVGYGDGFRITVSNDMFRVVDRLRNLKASVMELLKKGQVTVNVEGKTCKVLGQIGMCHTAIDITDINAKIGDNVTMNINPIFVKENVRREYR